MGSEVQLKPGPHLLFPWQRCPASPLLAQEEHVAWLRPQQAPADQQLLYDVTDRGCSSQWPGLLPSGSQAAGAESCELPQCLHCTLHQEQLPSPTSRGSVYRDVQTDRWIDGQRGGQEAGEQRSHSAGDSAHIPMVGTWLGQFLIWFTFHIIFKK